MWAQRSNKEVAEKNLIYLTINILDPENTDIQLDDQKLELKSRSEDDNVNYAVTLEFYKDVDAEKSTRHRTDRGLFFVLQKKEAQEEFWPRLTKVKHPYVRTDFDKWVDEDEQDPQANEDFGAGMGDMGGLDLSSLTGGQGGMPDLSALAGGMGGMGGMEGLGGMGAMGAMGGEEGEGDDGNEDDEIATPSTVDQEQKIQEIE